MSGRLRAGALALSALVVFYVLLGGVLGKTAGEGAYRQLGVFSEVLARVKTDYVEDPDIRRVTAGALHGLLGSLDPYSSYLSPREYEEYKKRTQPGAAPAGDVGLALSKRFGLIVIVAVLPDGPAELAGLRSGEGLESIAGFSTLAMSLEQARMLLAGEPGTPVKLGVIRERRAEPQEMELVRARLTPPPVVAGRLEGDIGYLKVATFSEGRAKEIRKELKRLEDNGAKKLVLDLRFCAGGSVEEAVETARLFLDKGVIVALEGQKLPRQQFTAEGGKPAWRHPVSVLLNNATAGPAEVLAAALVDNQRAEAVGQRSFGMGSVQRLIELEDGAALVLSVAKYFSPKGVAIQEKAVTPTVEVAQDPFAPEPPLPHALPRGPDAVLDKALERLRAASARKAA